jgi:hypothetical protein
MVHKNYKWNISIKEGEKIAFDSIMNILKEKKENKIQINELIFLLNNRTKHVKLFNNHKKKNITNFIKTNFHGIQSFIENYENFLLIKESNGIIIKLNKEFENELYNDWIFVNDD